MTEKECLDNIVTFCNSELKKKSWLIFNDHTVTLDKTRLLQDYEKDANFPLPPLLQFEDTHVDHNGVKIENTLYKWSDICSTVVKYDRRATKMGEEGKFITDNYLVFCLQTGKVIEVKLGDIRQYSNLLIHYIEQYKLGIGK
ncbi:MAG: hypothetical protein H0W73_19690 [Bacteroidetes bacterium]|nr:hypothetical protein [Bacteroidota bacterium]